MENISSAMQLAAPENWKEYELIDSGNQEKLERFGKYILIRPENQAIWNKNLPEKEWLEKAHARFVRDSKKKTEEGGWTLLKKMDESWNISYTSGHLDFKLSLRLTSFGHVGLFPEQADNWEFIFRHAKSEKPFNILNLFAYTGGSSLAARQAGAQVIHVDAVRNIVNWAAENQKINRMQEIRWVVEDALKFARREVKRGRHYDGIILDPPAYGRGPGGEKWLLEENLTELLELCHELLAPKHSFLVLSLYSMGFSALVPANLADILFKPDTLEFGEFYLHSSFGQKVPRGAFLRLTR